MNRAVLILIIPIILVSSLRPLYSQADSVYQKINILAKLGPEIDRFESDTDQYMKCENALKVFLGEFYSHPDNAYAALYAGRAYDHIAALGGICPIADSEFLDVTDSALFYYSIAERLHSGITERKHGFSVPVLIGHVYGTRCLFRLKQGELEKARGELIEGMKQGGFSPAQLEVCRLILDFADSGSIIFSAGDDDTFPTMYLQMVDRYRTDVSVINMSLISFRWYLELFTANKKDGFAHVDVNFSKKELDSFDVIVTSKELPARRGVIVDANARERFGDEVGFEVPPTAEICFPVFESYEGGFYTLPSQRAIASILLANKWKRHVFFGSGGLQGYLKCTGVAIREGILLDELYPVGPQSKDQLGIEGRWFHTDKMRKIFLHDAKMQEFVKPQTFSFGVLMIYYSLLQIFYADTTHESRMEVIRRMKLIPPGYLAGSERTVFEFAQGLYLAGFVKEAAAECIAIMPVLYGKVSQNKNEFGENEVIYVIALIITGHC
ncbi:MAG: hypothetical protein ABI778_12740, partial [Ignavibacteriota bacterium]